MLHRFKHIIIQSFDILHIPINFRQLKIILNLIIKYTHPTRYTGILWFEWLSHDILQNTMADSDSDSDSDKFIQQKYIQVPYQVYMSFLEIQITL